MRWIIVPGHASEIDATHRVDVTGETLRRGIASLEAHAAYLAALPDHPAPADFIPKLIANDGKAMGVDYAVLFRAHDRNQAMCTLIGRGCVQEPLAM